MSEADLRQIAEEGLEIMAPIEKLIAGATSGCTSCPNCQGDALWQRTGLEWSIECVDCKWSGAGRLRAEEIQKN